MNKVIQFVLIFGLAVSCTSGTLLQLLSPAATSIRISPLQRIGGCPLCDASVYSYCDYSVFHDSCCCGGAYGFQSHQCGYADCSHLYANSCEEHQLIVECCCNQP